MTIDEAIEILGALYGGGMSPSHPNPKEAFKLGIEALKRLQEGRKVDHAFAWKRLPGETEEGK